MSERIEKLKTFLEKTPDDCFLNHALALEYIKLEQEEDARPLLEKNLSNDPGYVASYYQLGKLLERAGEPGKAITVYEQGMQAAREAGDMHTYNELEMAKEDLE